MTEVEVPSEKYYESLRGTWQSGIRRLARMSWTTCSRRLTCCRRRASCSGVAWAAKASLVTTSELRPSRTLRL
eukprot:3527066-Alexandrium_andersonii.AAC.1